MGDSWVLESSSQQVEDTAPRPVPVAGVVYCRSVAQGLRGTMVLVAVGPTQVPLHGGPREVEMPAPHGEWHVAVQWLRDNVTEGSEGTGKRLLRVHAWAERNDVLYGNLRAQQGTVASDDRVPELTEFMPESRSQFCRAGPMNTDDDAIQPDYSLSSLAAGIPPDQPDVAAYDEVRLGGRVVVVGGYRVGDGEMASYSSGGPSRLMKLDRNDAVTCGSYGLPSDLPWRVDAGARSQPDADAPSDVGTALRGLRVTGMRAGQHGRLSGTSAAAPSVARYIANMWVEERITHGHANSQQFGLQPPTSDVPGPDSLARPTGTPLKDDRFRKGRQRIG